MSRLAELAVELEALRTEMLELETAEEPTDDQSARMEAILPEWDDKKAEHDRLAERAEKVEQVRTAALAASSVERTTPEVIVRHDPFEDVNDLKWRSDRDPTLRSRALQAFEGTKQRGVDDAALESLVEKIETIPGVARHALVHGSPAYRSAFEEVMRAGFHQPMFSAEEAEAVRTAMSLTGANGGYTLPTLLDPTLIHTGAATKDPIREIARTVSGTVNVWHGVTVGNVTTYWEPEATTIPEGSPTFGSPAITAGKLTAWVTGSYEVFEDTNLLNELPGLIRESMGFAENTAFITGSGTNGPKGIVTAISATAGSTVTATTRGSFTTASAVDVFALLGSLPTRYEDRATWLANKSLFNIVRQMSTASQGSYFWTDLNSGIKPSLLGAPLVQASDMSAATTSGTVVAVLGDFSQYVIYDRIGIQIEFVQNVFDQATGLPTGQRGLVSHKRVGADVTDVNAFRFLKA